MKVIFDDSSVNLARPSSNEINWVWELDGVSAEPEEVLKDMEESPSGLKGAGRYIRRIP